MNTEWISRFLNQESRENLDDVVTKMCETILSMENYIHSLEDKLEKTTRHMSDKKVFLLIPGYIPTHTLSEWIHICPIHSGHMDVVFKHTVLEGFKQYVYSCLEYSSSMMLPLTVLDGKPKRLFGFYSAADDSDSEHEGGDMRPKEHIGAANKWQQMTENQIHMFIEDIWRKMLEFYYTSPREPEADETQRDLNKKKLLGMRKILTEKHGKEIERYLMKHLKQKI